MESQSFLRALILCLVAIIGSTQAQLQANFYANTCPKAEEIVNKYVREHIRNAPSLAAAIIRLQFHDCFIRGCDASVLVNSTTNNQAEKDSIPNLTLRGFSFIDGVKSAVEAECPGVVSCADILSLTARDAVVATGGPYWTVTTGRRDGTVSKATEVIVPSPFDNITTLQGKFAGVGLDLKDLVLLSGAHTIGVAHCSPSVSIRLFNFTGKGDQDPSLDREYAENLKKFKCKTINDNTTLVEMDPGSRKTFDLGYYGQVAKRRGLFQSDAALLNNPVTKSLLNQLLQGSVENFWAEFAKSMEKMILINVKTGTQGQIRKKCAFVNN